VKADIHSHSSNSDGTWNVKKLLEEAERLELECYAVTDHDNLEGSIQALNFSSVFSGILIPGMEVSTKVDGRTVHLLAFFPKIGHDEIPDVHEVLDKVKNSRYHRMEKMVEKGIENGFKITMEEIHMEVTKDGSSADIIARPHLARVLVQKGYAGDMDEAFDKYLSEGKLLYVERFTLNYMEWIKLVHKNSGIVVWAHPLFYQEEDVELLRKSFDLLYREGIDGIEIVYPYNKRRGKLDLNYIEEGQSFLQQKIEENKLLWTSGGDFHGDNGILGFAEIDDEMVERLLRKIGIHYR